jgi:hypothetical protein
MTISCYCADGPDQKGEISPRDQELSPRKKLFFGKVNLRKAIANSSPLRTNSREDIAAYLALESPRTKLKRSQSVNFSPQRDNKTLRDVISLEEGSSPRGEMMVLALLKKTKEKLVNEEENVNIFREKASKSPVDFKYSSPNPKLLVLESEHEKPLSNKNHELISKPADLSEKEQELVERGVYIKLPLLDDVSSKAENLPPKSE